MDAFEALAIGSFIGAVMVGLSMLPEIPVNEDGDEMFEETPVDKPKKPWYDR